WRGRLQRFVAAQTIALLALAAPSMRAQTGTRFNVVINEVASRSAVGGDRAVELYNYGAPVDLNGWILTYFSGASSNAFTLPTFTLPRHAVVTVRWAAGTNDAGTIYTGAALGFTPGSNSQLALKSSGSAIGGEDYLCWGICTGNPNMPAPLSWNGAVTW